MPKVTLSNSEHTQVIVKDPKQKLYVPNPMLIMIRVLFISATRINISLQYTMIHTIYPKLPLVLVGFTLLTKTTGLVCILVIVSKLCCE